MSGEAAETGTTRRATVGAAIHCVLPDDGTDKRLLIELREKFGIVQAGSSSCRSVGALAYVKTARGKLPESVAARVLHVFCPESRLDEVFDFIFWTGQLDRPGRGSVWQETLLGMTPYELPADVPDEED